MKNIVRILTQNMSLYHSTVVDGHWEPSKQLGYVGMLIINQYGDNRQAPVEGRQTKSRSFRNSHLR